MLCYKKLGSDLDGMGDKAEQQKEKGKESEEQALGIERSGIVDRRGAKEAKYEENGGPNVPIDGMGEESQEQ